MTAKTSERQKGCRVAAHVAKNVLSCFMIEVLSEMRKDRQGRVSVRNLTGRRQISRPES